MSTLLLFAALQAFRKLYKKKEFFSLFQITQVWSQSRWNGPRWLSLLAELQASRILQSCVSTLIYVHLRLVGTIHSVQVDGETSWPKLPQHRLGGQEKAALLDHLRMRKVKVGKEMVMFFNPRSSWSQYAVLHPSWLSSVACGTWELAVWCPGSVFLVITFWWMVHEK